MKKVLILSGSPRKDGNSDLLCSEFMRGAQESGNEVQKIFVRSKKIVPCNACYYCRDHGGKCALNDGHERNSGRNAGGRCYRDGKPSVLLLH